MFEPLKKVYPVRLSNVGGAINVVTLLKIFEATPLSFVAINVVKYVVEAVKSLIVIFTLLGSPTLQYVKNMSLLYPPTGPDSLESSIEY